MKGLIVETETLSHFNPLSEIGGSAGLNCYHFPMIYYPVSFMLRRGVKDITLALTETSIKTSQRLFRSGRQYGVNIRYKILDQPSFLAKEILEDTEHFRGHSVIYSSANTILWGKELRNSIKEVLDSGFTNATIFGAYLKPEEKFETMVIDPYSHIKYFGLCEKDDEELYDTCLAVPKVGIYPSDIVEVVESIPESMIAEILKPINNSYLEKARLEHIFVHSDELWYQVDSFITLQKLNRKLEEYALKHQTIIGSPERNSYQSGLISEAQFEELISKYKSEEFKNLLRFNL
ncbi:MAG: sugar phosphate nucleotidyltransferase [Patescibacteria group bacterium]